MLRSVGGKVLGVRVRFACLEDVTRGKLWAYGDPRRRLIKRKKDELDLIRLAEAYPGCDLCTLASYRSNWIGDEPPIEMRSQFVASMTELRGLIFLRRSPGAQPLRFFFVADCLAAVQVLDSFVDFSELPVFTISEGF